jgi:hypothetical protein
MRKWVSRNIAPLVVATTTAFAPIAATAQTSASAPTTQKTSAVLDDTIIGTMQAGNRAIKDYNKRAGTESKEFWIPESARQDCVTGYRSSMAASREATQNPDVGAATKAEATRNQALLAKLGGEAGVCPTSDRVVPDAKVDRGMHVLEDSETASQRIVDYQATYKNGTATPAGREDCLKAADQFNRDAASLKKEGLYNGRVRDLTDPMLKELSSPDNVQRRVCPAPPKADAPAAKTQQPATGGHLNPGAFLPKM